MVGFIQNVRFYWDTLYKLRSVNLYPKESLLLYNSNKFKLSCNIWNCNLYRRGRYLFVSGSFLTTALNVTQNVSKKVRGNPN